MFGLVNIHKPKKMTSREVVNLVQRRVRPHKVGHAGTLDPLATGVLLVGIGPATRLLEYVHAMEKQYRAVFLFDKSSDTDDTDGRVVDQTPAGPTPTLLEVESATRRFVGQIEQVPPVYSAIKVRGKRSYQLARSGMRPHLKARPVQIHDLVVLDYAYPRLEIDVVCGSGTYIRALGRDIALRLGTTAVMSELTRTRIGVFDLVSAVGVDRIMSEPISEMMLSPELALGDVPRIELSADEVEVIANGGVVVRDDASRNGVWAGIHGGQLVSILKCEDRQIAPVRNFPR